MQGIGIYTFNNGDEYRGEFAKGKFNGKGAFRTKEAYIAGIFAEGEGTRLFFCLFARLLAGDASCTR